jgi:hypothetical protein
MRKALYLSFFENVFKTSECSQQVTTQKWKSLNINGTLFPFKGLYPSKKAGR